MKPSQNLESQFLFYGLPYVFSCLLWICMDYRMVLMHFFKFLLICMDTHGFPLVFN